MNEGEGPIESEYTTEVHDGKKTLQVISYTRRDEDAVRLTILPNIKSRTYGRGFILRAYSVEELDGSRYLRLYGDEGFFLKILLRDDADTEQTEPEEHPEDVDSIVYVGDKIMTG